MLASCELRCTIPAKDLQASKQFYVDTLGLELVDEMEGGALLRSGGSISLLYETEFSGTAQHTIASFESSDVDEEIAELRSHGITFEVYDDLPGVEWNGDVAVMGEDKGVWFKDPDGNILALFQMANVPAHAG